MATLKIVRPLRPLVGGIARPHYSSTYTYQPRRSFLPGIFSSSPNPLASDAESTSAPNGAQTQTLTASRTLPYPAAPIYSIIADVAAYPSFLPYCQSSTITRWSAPDPQFHRRWPSEDKIVVGYGRMVESFTSRVYCVPGRIIESVSGLTQTRLPADEIRHHLEGDKEQAGGGERDGGLLTHLRNRWTVEPVGGNATKISLALEFAFANPIYTALSAGAAPKVAEVMIKAFEGRVKELLDANPEMMTADLDKLGGSSVK